jgi:hypothetical protein
VCEEGVENRAVSAGVTAVRNVQDNPACTPPFERGLLKKNVNLVHDEVLIEIPENVDHRDVVNNIEQLLFMNRKTVKNVTRDK